MAASPKEIRAASIALQCVAMKHRVARLALAAAALACGASALAADGEWNYRIIPYVWGASIYGTPAHERLPVTLHPSASFSDIWNNLDFVAMLAFEAQRDRRGVIAELVTLSLSGTASMPVPPVGISMPVELGGATTTLLLAYQCRWIDEPQFHVDLIAGARYWSAQTEFSYALAAAPPPPIPQAYRGSQTQDWVDLQLGIKGRREFDNGAYVGAWLAGGSRASGLTLDAMLLAGYRFDERWSLTAGCRWLKIDYRTDRGFTFDATLAGPGLGLEYVL